MIHSHTTHRQPAVDDSIAASEDLLLEFFDFFDKTASDVYAYILHRTRETSIAEDITMDLYFSLLQRRRFFWWRSSVRLPEIFSLAEKAITKSPSWQSAPHSVQYQRTIANAIEGPSYDKRMEQAQLILRALRKLPIKEQKIATLQFLLGWGPAKAAKTLEMERAVLEQEYQRTLSHMIEQLEDEEAFKNIDPGSILSSIHLPPALPDAKKAEMRIAILEKFRTAQMSSLRYVMPVAALLLITFSTGAIGMNTVEPLSLQKSKRIVAAAEALLLKDQIETYKIVERAEETSKRLAAVALERELTNISLDLAHPAIETQLKLEKTVYTSLREMGTKLFTLIGTWHKTIALLE